MGHFESCIKFLRIISLTKLIIMQINSNCESMKEEGTELDQKIRKQIKQIYQVLIRFGYPELVSSSVLDQQRQIQKYLGDYFQPTPKRSNLIEWLILTINPLYSQEMHSKTNQKRIVLNNLWKLGVMPFSKHTNNLDYEKYVQGLLGYENAVNLVYNLSTLLLDIHQFNKSKEDSKFTAFLQEIISNYDSLVNLDFDPYKISFPPAYQHLSDQEFQTQYQTNMARILASKELKQDNQEILPVGSEYEDIFKEFQQNKQKFQEVYQQMIGKIKSVVERHAEMIESWKQLDNFEGKTLKISNNLPKVYKLYKQKIKISKLSQSKLSQQKCRIKTLIQSLNDTVCL